jgi:hypothetical protein
MPFFKFPEPPSKTTEEDALWAKQLHSALSKRMIVKKYSERRWSQEFRLLRTYVEDDHITKVLNWYCQNIRKPFVPLAFSAKSFRNKFPNIEQAMIRDIGEEVQISEDANQITRRLLNLYWPKITPDELKRAVQLSLDNYESFLSHDTKHFPIPIRNKLSSPVVFVEQWFRDLHPSIVDWQEWNGNIIKQAFHHEHKRFRARGRSWANEYCGDPSRWDRLIERNMEQ